MSVTVSANKTVSSRSPYVGGTFQAVTQKIVGRDGYLSGGLTTDDGATITVNPFSIIQFGIVAESLQTVTALAVPVGGEPWFVLASVPDDDPDTGIVLTATTDLTSASNGVIVAFKASGRWQNPRPVDIRGSAQNATEVGVEGGFALTVGVDGGGLLNQLDVATGEIVDPDGTRRTLPPTTGQSAKVASVLPPTPHEGYARNDVLVLRQRESFSPELQVLRGPTLPYSNSYTSILVVTASATATRASFYARPGGTINEQWWAWGDGTALHILGGPAGGAFSDTTLLSSGTISGTWIAGQRSSDNAVVLVYLDGNLLKVTAFNASLGTSIEAPVTISDAVLNPNAIIRPRAVMDASGLLHVVFEHNDGALQQIYYTKVETKSGAFGVAAQSVRYVAGGTTAKNDTWPSIGVDRFGNAHIAYITGTASQQFGDLAYAQIDNAGSLVGGAVQTFLVGNSAGYDDGTGFVTRLYDNFRQASIAVTPHDEVYIAMLGSFAGSGSVDELLLFSPTFKERLGYAVIQLKTSLNYVACSMTTNDHGGLHIWTVVSGATYGGEVTTIDTLVAARGRLDDTVLSTTAKDLGAITPPSFDMPVALGSGGDVVACFHTGTQGVCERLNALIGGVGASSSTKSAYTVHPNDVLLSTYRVAPSATGTVPVADGVFGSTFEAFNVRPKKMNFPILVGHNGDFHGYDALERAVDEAVRIGGEIVLRAGRHVLRTTVNINGSVSIRGESMAYIDASQSVLTSNEAFKIGQSFGYAAQSISGNKVRFDLLGAGFVHAGDFIELTGVGGTGFHRVAQVIPGSSTLIDVIVDDAYGATSGTPPAGTTVNHYPTGVRLENLCINAGVAAVQTNVIEVIRSYQAVFRNLAFVGSHTDVTATPGAPIVFTYKSVMPLIEQIDFTQFNAPDDHFAIDLGGGVGPVESPIVRFCRMRDGGPAIMVRSQCTYPQFAFIHGDDTDVVAQHFEVEAGRATSIYVSNCEGRFSGAAPDLAFIATNVGPRIRVPEIGATGDTQALELEDANTRAAAGITDNAIKLTDGTNQEFDGVSKDVVTSAVNERMLRAGDTMTGTLTMAAPIVTNGVTQEIGANAAGYRWTGYFETIDVASYVNTDLIPFAASSQKLGGPSNTWDVYLGNVHHTVRTATIPVAAYRPIFADPAPVYEGGVVSTPTLHANAWTSPASGTIYLDIPVSLVLLNGDRIQTIEFLVEKAAIGPTNLSATVYSSTIPIVAGSPLDNSVVIGATKSGISTITNNSTVIYSWDAGVELPANGYIVGSSTRENIFIRVTMSAGVNEQLSFTSVFFDRP